MTEKFKRYKDVISGALVVAFAVVMFLSTFQIRSIAGMQSIDSKFFPRLVAGVIFFLGLIILANGTMSVLRTKKETAPTHKKDASPSTPKQGVICTVQTLALIALYIFLMDKLGFILSTILYLFAQMIVLSTKEQRKYVLFAVISIVASVGVYLVFTHLLYLALPTGILG